MAVLTLHQGDGERTFAEHPIQTARKALLQAADLENDDWAVLLRRFAGSLPDRGALGRRRRPLVVDSGERVLADAAALMEARLPFIAGDDPFRKCLEQVVDLVRQAGL